MRRFLLVGVVVASLLVQTGAASAAVGCGTPAWQIVPTPNGSAGSNELWGVTALTAEDAWAVGEGWDDVEGHTTPLVEHWDGAEWTVADTPTVGDAGGLFSADGTASDDVWAVGYFTTSNGQIGRGLIQHWNGSDWQTVDAAIPEPGPNVTTMLTDVLALAPDDAWAVGRWSPVPDMPPSPLIERWDGTSWEVVEAPGSERWTEATAVAATGPDDVWVVGNTEVFVEREDALVERALIEHWDGEVWTVHEAPFNRRHPLNPFGLEEVVAISATDVWAVGGLTRADGRSVNLALHWDGQAWTRVATPQPSESEQLLTGVAALSPERVWAVGRYIDDAADDMRTLVLRWNGESWRRSSSEDRRMGSELHDVAALNDWQFAVGSFWSNRGDGNYRTLGLQRCPA